MNRTGFAIVVGALFAIGAAAQSQSGAQAGAQASGQTSVQASKEGAQANASGATATSATAQSGQSNASLASGSTFNAALNAPLDSKKAKPGDPVTAHCTEPAKSEGKTVLPKGTKVIGHVTQASARGKGDAESSLGVVFDKAILKNGQEVPLNVAIQAAAAAQGNVAAGSDLDTIGGAGASAGGYAGGAGRGALGGVTSAAGGAAGGVTNTAANVGSTAGGAVNSTVGATANAAGSVGGVAGGATGGLNAAGQLTSNSRGVFGLNGVNLNSATSSSTEGSVFTSAGKNVHLDSGTRMLLVSQAAAGTQGESKHAAPAKAEPKPGANHEPSPEPKSRPENPNLQ